MESAAGAADAPSLMTKCSLTRCFPFVVSVIPFGLKMTGAIRRVAQSGPEFRPANGRKWPREVRRPGWQDSALWTHNSHSLPSNHHCSNNHSPWTCSWTIRAKTCSMEVAGKTSIHPIQNFGHLLPLPENTSPPFLTSLFMLKNSRLLVKGVFHHLGIPFSIVFWLSWPRRDLFRPSLKHLKLHRISKTRQSTHLSLRAILENLHQDHSRPTIKL